MLAAISLKNVFYTAILFCFGARSRWDIAVKNHEERKAKEMDCFIQINYEKEENQR